MKRHRRISRRRGTVLVLVLVLIPVLALGGYAFTHAMRAETKASVVAMRQAHARWVADAGIQATLALLSDPSVFQQSVDFNDNPAAYAAQAVGTGSDGFKGAYSLVAPKDENGSAIRYGLVSEGAKIPLVAGGKVQLTREGLMNVPGMTEEIADSLLDWLDRDDTARENGAESNYYGGQSRPVQARNGQPLSLDELLQVRGVTPAVLYGSDANLDGLPSSDEYQISPTFSRGLYQYFTVNSVADNRKADGTAKTNLNGGEAKTVAAAVKEEFGDAVAGYYIAYKTKNSNIPSISAMIDAEVEIDATQFESAVKQAELDPATVFKALNLQYPIPMPPMPQGQGGQGGQPAPGGGQGGGGGQPGGGGGAGGGGQQGGGQQSDGGGRGGAGSSAVSVTSGPGGAAVTTAGAQGGQGGPGGGAATPPVKIASPWKAADAASYLDTALANFSIDDSETATGVIDVLNAPAVVLQVLPGVTPEIAEKINYAGTQRASAPLSAAFLLTENAVTLEQIRQLEPLVTVTNRVFRLESVGFFDKPGPVARIEAIIDASGDVPKVVARRDLTPLGNGYPQEMLRSASTVPGN